MPVKRLRKTDTLIAFHHPRLAYPLHILLIRKSVRRSLTDLTGTDAP
jgi:hypothetical protein